MRVTISTSPFRRKSSTVRDSSRRRLDPTLRAQGPETGQMMLSFRQECGLPATKSAEKPVMFESTTLQRLNQSIRRTNARQQIGHGPKMRSAARRSRETGWGLLLLAWFAGNVVVATLAWFLVSLFLK
jgi:hypothetical protein